LDKTKVGVVFGGMSTEHDVSVISGTSVINNLDKNKYEIYPIYIDENGIWYNTNIEAKNNMHNKNKIDNELNYLKNLDVVFPVLHGLYGEDGTIQGLLELIKVPYVGCKVLSSSIGMDKVYSKIIFEKANINQAKYEYIRKYKNNYIYINKDLDEEIYSLENICNIIEKSIKYPMFVKPSNSGSSVGINKAKNFEELKKSIDYAAKFDNKILIEENINGKEIECAVLGNEEAEVSCLGEIKPADDFYSFDAKYKNIESKLIIPAKLNDDIINNIKKIAVKAFKAINGKGLARVDFFVDDISNKIYINEINTMPGFTPISMYPKLWENSGIKYSELLDCLINLSIKGE
jgi:D-alanine-D-alanine ligase